MVEAKIYKNSKGTWSIGINYKDFSSDICVGLSVDFETYKEAEKEVKLIQKKINKSNINKEPISIKELQDTKVDEPELTT